jgi:hypothetical protein
VAVIYSQFLRSILHVHEQRRAPLPYPFFDPACVRYEALRAGLHDQRRQSEIVEQYGLTDYAYRSAQAAFEQWGTAGLIGLGVKHLTEPLPAEVERQVFVLKAARPWIPATKMVLILKGFGHVVALDLMRHLYASYGWALGTKPYSAVDFVALNQKVAKLDQLRSITPSGTRSGFFDDQDRLQRLLEVFRTLGTRGITRRYPGSRVRFAQHKQDFLSLGLLGLVERAPLAFRNSKLGFKEEGWMILSKIQQPEKDEAYYRDRLASKRIEVDASCLSKIFSRWHVKDFQSQFPGDLARLLEPEGSVKGIGPLPSVSPLRLDAGFLAFLDTLEAQGIPLANPGIFLFLPLLQRLGLLEKAAALMEVDPDSGYSWFSLLLLNLGRILGGISSVSKACRTREPSFPLLAGLVEMPCKDSLLNGLAGISEPALLQLRRHLTRAALDQGLIEGKRVAFDFHLYDFTGDDVALKQIGKGPSPKRQICFPGFRPHLAWDVVTGAPISLEFRNGRARATTTIKRFVRELLDEALGVRDLEHVYLDSEYTAEHVWRFIVDPEEGLGADLTMCIKQNRRVKKAIQAFLETEPTWLFFDEAHNYTEQTFTLPIAQTAKQLHCVLKRHEPTGRLRCFGSTLSGLTGQGILQEYQYRWQIENGIKDLIGNYFFDRIPGIDPHRINLHYFVVTLARLLFEMLSRDYVAARNADQSKKTIGTLRPEFLTGVNVTLSRVGDTLYLKWLDPYPEKQHQALTELFDRLTHECRNGLLFLGGLRLVFSLAPPKAEEFHNQLRRQALGY